MTDDLIPRIEEALAKATPGPWMANTKSNHGDFTIWGPGGADDFLANIGAVEMGESIAFDTSKSNAELIAHAPEWLRYLLERVNVAEDWLVEVGRCVHCGLTIRLCDGVTHAGVKMYHLHCYQTILITDLRERVRQLEGEKKALKKWLYSETSGFRYHHSIEVLAKITDLEPQ